MRRFAVVKVFKFIRVLMEPAKLWTFVRKIAQILNMYLPPLSTVKASRGSNAPFCRWALFFGGSLHVLGGVATQKLYSTCFVKLLTRMGKRKSAILINCSECSAYSRLIRVGAYHGEVTVNV
jgi:hypothetical protein